MKDTTTKGTQEIPAEAMREMAERHEGAKATTNQPSAGAMRAVRSIMQDGTPERALVRMAQTVDRETAAPDLLKALRDLIPYIDDCEEAGQIKPEQAQVIREVVSDTLAAADGEEATR